MRCSFTSTKSALLGNGRGADVFTPWTVTIDTDEQTITVSKRNRIMIGVDEDTIAFRFIRRVTIDQHVFGADITIKAVGGSITAYSLDKNDCKKIKEILMEFNRTRKGRGIIFA